MLETGDKWKTRFRNFLCFVAGSSVRSSLKIQVTLSGATRCPPVAQTNFLVPTVHTWSLLKEFSV